MPTLVTKFRLQVANRGTAPFGGRVAIGWTDDEDEIRYHRFREISDICFVRLLPDSVTVVQFQQSHPGIPSDTHLLLTILTDVFEEWPTAPSYRFGNTPYHELSIENNMKEYVVQ